MKTTSLISKNLLIALLGTSLAACGGIPGLDGAEGGEDGAMDDDARGDAGDEDGSHDDGDPEKEDDREDGGDDGYPFPPDDGGHPPDDGGYPPDDGGYPPDDGGWPGDGGECTYCDRPRPRAFSLNLSNTVGLAIVANEETQMLKPGDIHRFRPLQAHQAAGEETGGTDGSDPGHETDGSHETDGGTGGFPDDGGTGGFPDGETGGDPSMEGGDADMAEDDSLYKLDEDGNMMPAMEETDPEGAEKLPEGALEEMWDPGPIPRISAIGLSPDSSVYVLFEHSFLYRVIEDGDQNDDVWSPSSPYTCQLFRSSATWDGTLEGGANIGDLECITNQHEIPTWNDDQVMQFDRDGALYFPGTTPGDWKQIFYKYDPATNDLTEVVNANICWHDVEVTPAGSVFYTGQGGENCDGTSFFRYISPDNRLVEIARDWWNFKYLSERDPADPDLERIVFYGPDPRSTADGWQTACLFRYDPTIEEAADRVSEVTQCVWSAGDYVAGPYDPMMGADSPSERAAKKARCEEDGRLFMGGEGPEELQQTSDGTIYVSGRFQQKKAGTYSCSLQVNADHCDTLDSAHGDQSSCEAAGGNWIRTQDSCSDPQYTDEWSCSSNGHQWTWGWGTAWYNDIETDACFATSVPEEVDEAAGVYYAEGYTVDWDNCYGEPDNFGDGLSENVEGIAILDDEDGLQLVSEANENVENFWIVDYGDTSRFFYSVYDVGVYSLRVAEPQPDGSIIRRTLLTDYEVYSVNRDPAHQDRIFFAGLYFSTNSYLFGSVDVGLSTEEEILASLEVKEGVTGEVETLIIFPDF